MTIAQEALSIPEILYLILLSLVSNQKRDLLSCCLVSKTWTQISQDLLFHQIRIDPQNISATIFALEKPDLGNYKKVRELEIIDKGAEESTDSNFETSTDNNDLPATFSTTLNVCISLLSNLKVLRFNLFKSIKFEPPVLVIDGQLPELEVLEVVANQETPQGVVIQLRSNLPKLNHLKCYGSLDIDWDRVFPSLITLKTKRRYFAIYAENYAFLNNSSLQEIDLSNFSHSQTIHAQTLIESSRNTLRYLRYNNSGNIFFMNIHQQVPRFPPLPELQAVAIFLAPCNREMGLLTVMPHLLQSRKLIYLNSDLDLGDDGAEIDESLRIRLKDLTLRRAVCRPGEYSKVLESVSENLSLTAPIFSSHSSCIEAALAFQLRSTNISIQFKNSFFIPIARPVFNFGNWLAICLRAEKVSFDDLSKLEELELKVDWSRDPETRTKDSEKSFTKLLRFKGLSSLAGLEEVLKLGGLPNLEELRLEWGENDEVRPDSSEVRAMEKTCLERNIGLSIREESFREKLKESLFEIYDIDD